MKVLLCGYSGHCPERLREICVELNAVVFDVRLKPYSKDSRWSAPELAALLGERYVGLPQWGNPAKLDCPDERTFPETDAEYIVQKAVERAQQGREFRTQVDTGLLAGELVTDLSVMVCLSCSLRGANECS